MLNQLRDRGTVRLVLAGVFVLVIVASAAVIAVPAWSQTPTQEEGTAAIEAESAQVREGLMGRGHGGMFERMAAYFRGPAGGHAGMMGGRGGMPGAMQGGRFDLASRALGRADEISLTDVQRQGLEEARDTHRRQQIERDASMKLLGLDLAELLGDDSADLAAIEQKMNEAAGLKVQERMAALRYQRNVKGILSAEQIEQLNDFGDRAARRRPTGERAPRTPRQR